MAAIAGKAEQGERSAEFREVAEARYSLIAAAGKTIPWVEMRRYLEARVAGKAAARPRARRLAR